MNVSIVIPAYKPDKKILGLILRKIKEQKYNSKVEVLVIDENKGFAEQINIGIKKAKNEIVVELPQDCVPEDNLWLKNLMAPFENPKIIASVSKVKFPEELWRSMGVFARALNIKERGTIKSLLDGKGTAYKKEILKKIGYFDCSNFLYAGEDYDTYMKIKNLGKIAYPEATIIHMHPTTFIKRLKKTYQYSNGYGALVRIYGNRMYRGHVGFINALPFFGMASYLVSYPFKRGDSESLIAYILTSLVNHPYYFLGFWKGFFKKKQTVR